MTKVVIAGGGFGGARAALDLARARLPDVKIVLISDKPHFEYHAALYRVVTGRSPLEVCIPLNEIFEHTGVEVVIDTIVRADLAAKTLTSQSGSRYVYDFAILALGSETVYFNIPGLQYLSFGFKTITEALALKRHLHELLESKDRQTGHLVVAGGGASGTELAGELAVYAKKLARQHKYDSSITIDVVEAGPRLVPALPEDFSKKIAGRLRALGVNVFFNQPLLKEDVEQVYLKDMQMHTKSVIWTAGIKPHHLYAEIFGLSLDKKGRVVVNQYLEAPQFPNVFVIGDAAATEYAGMAQTAIHDGIYAAQVIASRISGRPVRPYVSKKPYYAIPVGPGWAAVLIGARRVYGYLGWMLRRLADLRFFLSILPVRKALLAFRNEKTLCESCLICTPEEPV